MKLNYKKLATEIISKKFDLGFERKKRISLRELSKKIGVSAATLSRVLNGKKMDVDTFFRLCTWLKKDVNYFITKR